MKTRKLHIGQQATLLQSERGSPIMELLLFTPIALLFIFVATDAGLAYLDGAAMADALRSGLLSEKACLSEVQGEVAATATPFTPNISQSQLEQVLQCMGGKIAENVLRTKQRTAVGDTGDYRITLTPVVLRTDQQTGELLGYTPIDFTLRSESAGQFDLRSAVPSYPVKSRESFLSKQLADEMSGGAIVPGTTVASPSTFAIPISATYSLTNPGSASVRYLDSAVLVYAEITTLTRHLARSYVRQILGRFYALQLQELYPLRMQLG